jgi:two-component system chemotaxis sensor kinase CheA
MDTKHSDFQARLLATFKVEAHEHINAVAAGLVELEHVPSAERQAALIETVFREAHSLKGAARAVNLTDIEKVCQALEGVFAALKRREISVSVGLFDTLHRAVGTLNTLLASPEAAPTASQTAPAAELLRSLGQVLQGALPPSTPAELATSEAVQERGASTPEALAPLAEDVPVGGETVRVSTARLAAVLLQAEELLAIKLMARQSVAELQEIHTTLTAWTKAWDNLRPEMREVQRWADRDGAQHGHGTTPLHLRHLLEFMHGKRDVLHALDTKLMALSRSAEHEQRMFGTMVEHLLEEMKTVLMLPFSTLLEGFPRLVRTLSRQQGKEVALVIYGGDIKIDKRILEDIKDPLMHLVRNCLDHGIEGPEERARQQKPRRGTITITIARHNGRSVEIRVADDGAGIDAARVQTAAMQAGVLTPEEATSLSPPEVLSLVFQSGVSTSPMVTDISGRGLGLAIVREKVEQVAGSVAVTTQPGTGTTFRLVLPLTLATFRGLIVRVYDRLLVVPTTAVECVVRVHPEAIKTVQNRETLTLGGRVVSLVRLAETLELRHAGATPAAAESAPAVVLVAAERRIAFLVDEVLSEQEVLVKSLGKQLSRVRNIAGATVLGTGKVVPILHVADLMHSAVRASAAGLGALPRSTEPDVTPRHSVLVVEDSITSRTLLKNILETAGYVVETAVDGLDAFATLQRGTFDLVVSDVDMPRLNGFDLTAKIRADRQLAHVPVVLVTALDSRTDREHGIEVGANAYIVKSSFDQSNLLEVLQRLL